MSSNWAALPADLLRTIAEMLTTDAADYIRFRAVCSTWQSSTFQTPPHIPTQLPWLLLDPETDLQCRFFSLTADKMFESISLPYTRSLARVGSSHGWLAFLDKSTESIFLQNPITRSILLLPSRSSFPDEIVFIKKIVLSSNPCVDKNYIVLAILNVTGKIAFCRNGDHSWTYIDEAQDYCRDVVYHDGLFYAINKSGDIAVCDVHGPKPKVSTIKTAFIDAGHLQYLATSSDNKILLIGRYLYFDHSDPFIDLGYSTVRFEVFRLDLNGARWDQVTDLGDAAVFLGENSTLALSSRDFRGCRGNCIYYTDDRLQYNYTEKDTDSGIYSLANKHFDRLPYCSNSYDARFWTPLWLTPYQFL